MENFVKVIHPFDSKLYGDRFYPVFCKIEFKDGRLSITGVEGPTVGGNCHGSCGQIQWDYAHRNPEHDDKRNTNPTKPEELRFAPGWNAEKWLDLLEAWELWHLNDLHAECPHQAALGWTYEEHHGDTIVTELFTTRQGETEVSERYDEFAGHVCPVCGYRIGSLWLTVEVPEEVIAFLKSLPDTDRRPNWV